MATRNIDVNVRANVAQFQRNMRTAESSIKTLASALQSALVVNSFKAFGEMIVDAALSIDALATRADKLGTTARELSSLEHAANMMDVSASSLSGAIVKMNKALADAGDGSKPALAALAKLRLNLSDLKRMSVSEQFQAIAGALSNVSSVSQRTQIAMALMGRGAADVMPIFAKSREEIARFIAEGADATTALTDGVVTMASRIDDGLKRVTKAWENYKNKLVGVYGPTIAFWLERIGGQGGDSVPQQMSQFDFARDAAVKRFRKLEGKFGVSHIQEALDLAQAYENAGGSEARMFAVEIRTAIDEIMRLQDAMAKIVNDASVKKFIDIFPSLTNSAIQSGFTSGISGFNSALVDSTRAADLFAWRIESAMKRAAEAVRSENERMSESFRDLLRTPLDELEEFRKAGEKLVGREGGLSQEEFDQALVKKAELLGLLPSAITSVNLETPAALVRGSREEFSARIQAGTDRQEDAIRREIEEQTKQGDKQIVLQEKMERVLRMIDAHNKSIAVAN